ncbi:Rac/Rho-like_protein [Hexamita inflata]|uniref:Rac/Rho-like protein n=1 Tax=Hexamita inflata TaxID=28002 RepID=A0AA86RCU0_9EUKA|nr:Rac/Rho-like protein [Hexamita inflata]
MKSVIIGDAGVGKTSFLKAIHQNILPTDYIPTILDYYGKDITINNSATKLSIWDTAGREEFGRLRPLSYPQTYVFILCYSISNSYSFKNIVKKWIPEIKHYMPGVPFILVGTKSDSEQQVTFKEAERVAKKHRAFSHIVCSALNNFNVKLVVYTAVKAALQYQQELKNQLQTRKQCCK